MYWKFRERLWEAVLSMFIILLMVVLPVGAVSKKYAGITLNIVAATDPFWTIIRDKMVPEFEELSGMKVNVDIRAYPEMRSKILLGLHGKTAVYDMFDIDIVWAGEFAESKFSVPLNDLIERDAAEINWDDFVPACKNAFRWKGVQVGMPIGGYYYMEAYRKDVFENAGMLYPVTWSQFVDAAKKLYRPEKKMYGVVLVTKEGMPIVHNWWATFCSMGGKTFKDMPHNYTPMLDSTIAIETLKQWKELLKYAPPGAAAYDWGDAGAAYYQGIVAMYPCWASAASFDIENPEVSKVAGKTAYKLPPFNPYHGAHTPFGGWCIGINPYTEQKAASWEFIKWITSEKVSLEFDKLGGVPTRFSVLLNPELQNKYPVYQPALVAEAYNVADYDHRPRIPAWPMIEEIFGRELNAGLKGIKGIEQALKDGNKKLEKYMKGHDYPMGE